MHEMSHTKMFLTTGFIQKSLQLSLKSSLQGTGEMAQGVKCLLCEHENLGSDPSLCKPRVGPTTTLPRGGHADLRALW